MKKSKFTPKFDHSIPEKYDIVWQANHDVAAVDFCPPFKQERQFRELGGTQVITPTIDLGNFENDIEFQADYCCVYFDPVLNEVGLSVNLPNLIRYYEPKNYL